VAGNDLSEIERFKTYMHKCFHMKDLGKLKYLLGIEVSRGPDGIFLTQRKYANDIITEAGLLDAKTYSTPMEPNHKLASAKGHVLNVPKSIVVLLDDLYT